MTSPARIRRRRTSVASGLLLCVLCLVTGGCSTGTSTTSPRGPASDTVDKSWWLLFAVAALVCVIVIVAAVVPMLIRRRARVDTASGLGFVVIFGAVIPGVVFAGIFALSLHDIIATSSPTRQPKLTIDVIGHQWWWEARYAGTKAVTANEIHVPAGQPVRLRVRTADVIHSFWVPELVPKTDLLPKRINHTWLTADHPGTYHGECAEYCGLQHAHMDFTIVAQTPAQFRSWLAHQRAGVATPTSAEARRGRSVFLSSSCATCHTIRGTSANGGVGPDLTHVGSRNRLAAETIANTPKNMADWIRNSQSIKPGNRMPPQPLSRSDLHAVVTYLQGLK